ncbi:MAG: DNA repair protein RadC [Sedimenticolaceae bacterium]
MTTDDSKSETNQPGDKPTDKPLQVPTWPRSNPPTKSTDDVDDILADLEGIQSAPAATYAAELFAEADEMIIAHALEILTRRLKRPEAHITRPDDAKDLVKLRLAEHKAEVFAVLFLDNRHGVLAFEEMFRGTIDGASVHPREVVRRALHHNAAAVILSHNHPSGVAEPSQADQAITTRLRDALALIDVRTLDHLVVGSSGVVSFAERGLI